MNWGDDVENKFPKRKKLRMEDYNYNGDGAYFVTICTQNRQKILSKIVGDGAPDVPSVILTEIGSVVEKYILSSEKIPGIHNDCFVIMPNHIHWIFYYEKPNVIYNETPWTPYSVVSRTVAAFKRLVNKEIGKNVFQRSFMEHIIRDHEDYENHLRYISENPEKWPMDEFYNEGD